MGDPAKMLILDVIIKEIARKNLLGVVKESGKVLMSGLTDIQVRYSHFYFAISSMQYNFVCMQFQEGYVLKDLLLHIFNVIILHYVEAI